MAAELVTASQLCPSQQTGKAPKKDPRSAGGGGYRTERSSVRPSGSSSDDGVSSESYCPSSVDDGYRGGKPKSNARSGRLVNDSRKDFVVDDFKALFLSVWDECMNRAKVSRTFFRNWNRFDSLNNKIFHPWWPVLL